VAPQDTLGLEDLLALEALAHQDQEDLLAAQDTLVLEALLALPAAVAVETVIPVVKVLQD
jgi:hypothetical protein